MKTLAAVLRATGKPLELTRLDLQGPREGEVLVEVLAAGICRSDWQVMTGDTKQPFPMVLGHEGCGRVLEVGPGVQELSPRGLVILNWAPACGNCFYCDSGKPNLCSTFLGTVWAGQQLDATTRLSEEGRPVTQFCALGCFAEKIVVSEKSCVRAPEGIAPEVLALIGCAVTTGVGSVVNTAKAQPGSVVAVIGAGGVGLSTVLGARLAGASEVVVFDPLPSRARAAQELGASHVCSDREEFESLAKACTEGRGADYVFEASGSPAAQELCLSVVRPGGSVVLTGLSPMGTSTNLPGAVLVRQEITVQGSYYGSSNPPVDFLGICNSYLDGDLLLDSLISHHYRLDQINEAFEDMRTGISRRGVILF